MTVLTFRTELLASADEVWAHAASPDGINRELAPVRMTFPPEVTRLGPESVRAGEPLCTSWVLAFGVLPIERWEIVISEIGPRRFVERSRVLSLRQWTHEREVTERGGGCTLSDTLTFEPRLPGTGRVISAFIANTFRRRHRYLQRAFGTPRGSGVCP
jgi:ligand-binding SRPBCC domain-containing protein